MGRSSRRPGRLGDSERPYDRRGTDGIVGMVRARSIPGNLLLATRLWLRLGRVAWELRRRPLPQAVHGLGPRGERTGGGHRIHARRLGKMVDRALHVGPWRPRCLFQAARLVLASPRSGRSSRARDRPRCGTRSKDAHAWVELDGIDVGPPPGPGTHARACALHLSVSCESRATSTRPADRPQRRGPTVTMSQNGRSRTRPEAERVRLRAIGCHARMNDLGGNALRMPNRHLLYHARRIQDVVEAYSEGWWLRPSERHGGNRAPREIRAGRPVSRPRVRGERPRRRPRRPRDPERASRHRSTPRMERHPELASEVRADLLGTARLLRGVQREDHGPAAGRWLSMSPPATGEAEPLRPRRRRYARAVRCR